MLKKLALGAALALSATSFAHATDWNASASLKDSSVKAKGAIVLTQTDGSPFASIGIQAGGSSASASFQANNGAPVLPGYNLNLHAETLKSSVAATGLIAGTRSNGSPFTASSIAAIGASAGISSSANLVVPPTAPAGGSHH